MKYHVSNKNSIRAKCEIFSHISLRDKRARLLVKSIRSMLLLSEMLRKEKKKTKWWGSVGVFNTRLKTRQSSKCTKLYQKKKIACYKNCYKVYICLNEKVNTKLELVINISLQNWIIWLYENQISQKKIYFLFMHFDDICTYICVDIYSLKSLAWKVPTNFPSKSSNI